MSFSVVDTAVIDLRLDDNVTEPLARAVEEAKAEVEALGRTKAKIRVDADTEKARAELKLLQKELDSAAAKQKAYQKLVDEAEGSKKGGYATALKNAKTQADAARQEVKDQRDIVQAYQQKGRAIQLIGREVEKTLQDEAKAQKDATTAVKDAAKAADDARNADLKRAQGIQKIVSLQKSYADSQKKLNDLQKAYSRAQGSDKVRVKLDTARALADMEVLREQLSLLGDKPIDIKTDVSTSGRGVSLLKSITGGDDPRLIRNIGNEISDLGNKLKSARVNVGPFSSSLGAVLAIGTALTPVITGLIGALGALVAVTGAGLAGGIGLAAAGMTGFGLATIGVIAAVKPFISEVGKAKQYQDTLTAAIDKYGKGSKQANAAQKVFNTEMKTVPKTVQDTVKGFHDLDTEWKKATQNVASRDVGKIIGEGLKTAQSDLGFFARDTNKALDSITSGVTKIFTQLRGEDKAPLANIFGNFDSSIKPVLDAFSHLGDAFLRVTSSFSNFLPGLAKGFDSWAKGIDSAAKKSDGFANGVRTMVGAFRDLGHFIGAAAGFLLSFFKAGVGPGAGLLDRMTDSLHKLTDQMNTTSGQSKLTDFFERSVTTTVQLWAALLPLISAFVQFGQATAPAADIMLKILSAFTKLTALVVGWKPIQLVVGGALGLLAISKFTSILREAVGLSATLARNLGSFVTAGGSLSNRWASSFGAGNTAALTEAGGVLTSAGEALAASAAELSGAAASISEGSAAGAVTRTAEGAAPVVGAEAAEGAGIVAAGGEAEAAVGGVGSALLEFATGPVGLAIGGIAALTGALVLLGHSTDNGKQAVDTGRKNIQAGKNNPAFSAGAAGNQPIGGSVSNQEAVNKAAAAYYKLLDSGKGDTAAAKAALDTYNQALATQNTGLQDAQRFQKSVNDGVKQQVATATGTQVKAQDAVNKAQEQYNKDLKNSKEGMLGGGTARENLANDLKNLHKEQTDLNTVNKQALTLANQNAAAKLNEQRQLNGVLPVAKRYAQSVGDLTRTLASAGPAGARALKQLTDIPDPSKIVAVSKAFNNLTTAADRKVAIKIIADTADPEKAIAKLNALELKEKILKLLSTGGDNAIAAIAKINGKPLPAKVLHLLGNATDALSKHNQVAALQDVMKALRILGDDSSAMDAIGAVNGALGSLPSSKTISINTVYTSIFKQVGNSPRGHATGTNIIGYQTGVTPALAAVQTRAARIAEGKPTRRTQGGVYGAPTYLVGEENRPEFVISTNPAYRQKNVQYIKQAASLFGGHVEGFATGRGNFQTDKKPKPKPKHHTAFKNSVYDLPPKDRIGGVGTEDISNAISASQTKVSNDNSAVSKANQRVNTDNSAIKRYSGLKKPSALEKRDLANAKKDLGPANKALSGAKSRLSGDKGTLKKLNGILNSANDYIQKFTNIENEISGVGALMDAAAANPNDTASGVNPLSGNFVENKTWDYWRGIENQLEKQHTTLLRAAWSDTKKRVGKVDSSVAVGYVKTLAAALSQSIADQETIAESTDPNATGADTLTSTPESLSDFLQVISYGGQEADQALSALSNQYNNDQIGALQNPGNPAFIQAQQNDQAALVSFYQNVYKQAQGWTNPTYPGGLRPDPALLSEISGDLLGALQDQQSTATSLLGPSQAQLTGTALSDLYTNYGGNTANLLLGAAMGMSPTDMGNALAGGQAASAALSGQAASAASAGIVGGSGTSTAPGNTIMQTNNFSQPPEDPHIFAKNIHWELDSLA